jgi:Helix-loop-helix DNA-binding domain
MMSSSSSIQNTEGQGPTSAADTKVGDALNTLITSLNGRTGRKPDNSESGSSNGGNNSDNSALVSLGNTSFGFNFDSEESNSKEGQNDSNDDSDGNVQTIPRNGSNAMPSSRPLMKRSSLGSGSGSIHQASCVPTGCASLVTSSSLCGSNHSTEQAQAAARAVASLESIARSYSEKTTFTAADNAIAQREALDRKRKASHNDKDADSGGYNTDDDEAPSTSRASATGSIDKKGRKTQASRKERCGEDDGKREERNQREKERSFRISNQITELRDLLSSGGVVVPKGTKSSVLTEAASYIRMLQQHQYRSEM